MLSVSLSWMVSNASTDMDVDVRGHAEASPPAAHRARLKNQYAWRPGRGPWEMEILTAPPWLCDEIEKLIAEHGGVVRGVPAGDRPNYTGRPVKTTFGTAVIDGRERYMRDLTWANMRDLRMKDNPVPPGEVEMMPAWGDYARNVKVKNPLPGESHEDGLEREGRGLTVFRQKWKYAVSKWETEVAEAAKEWVTRQPQPEPLRIDPQTGEVLPPVLSEEQLTEGFVQPDYLVDGLLQKHYLYALTARTATVRQPSPCSWPLASSWRAVPRPSYIERQGVIPRWREPAGCPCALQGVGRSRAVRA
jgi:hypothetical protein